MTLNCTPSHALWCGECVCGGGVNISFAHRCRVRPGSHKAAGLHNVLTIGNQRLRQSPPERQKTAGCSPFSPITSTKTVYDLSDMYMTSCTVM